MGLKVAVLAGGNSSEKEVSLWSGEQVSAALQSIGHQVAKIDPAASGFLSELFSFNPDVVFIALHGRGGEDGTIQGFLETLGFPFTGSGVLASALAMNKEFLKTILAKYGLKTPPGLMIRRQSLNPEDNLDGLPDFNKLGWPLVVKPNSQGSTIGLNIVNGVIELKKALEEAWRYDPEVLIEEKIEGTEITVGVLGNEACFALPVIEIVSQREIYDYEAKYTQGMSRHIIPARLDNETIKKAQQYAVLAHRAIGCRGMSRVDMIANQNELTVLEINTIPGMTKSSLLPDAARAAGIEFPDLCDKLLNYALE